MAKVFANFPKDKNKQPKCHHWPALYWLCGSFSASLCTHQLDWQDVWFTLNQSASVPEQTFGLIRQHLRVIWCQRRTGTKKQLGTFWSPGNECMLYYLVHIQYWNYHYILQSFSHSKWRRKKKLHWTFIIYNYVKHCEIWFILLNWFIWTVHVNEQVHNN